MDEHYPWSNFQQRYVSPEGASSRAWGPYFLGAYDLANIKKSQALFVRKVSAREHKEWGWQYGNFSIILYSWHVRLVATSNP